MVFGKGGLTKMNEDKLEPGWISVYDQSPNTFHMYVYFPGYEQPDPSSWGFYLSLLLSYLLRQEQHVRATQHHVLGVVTGASY